MPCDSSSVARKLRCCAARSALTAGSSVGAFDAAVPRPVVALAVVVVLAVGLVVLLVVGDEIAQREAVVRGDEVDAGVRPPAVVLVEVGAAGEAVGELAERPLLAAPVVAHRVAVLAVPLAPAHREVADLVAALADVPRLGDQLDVGEHRVLVNDVEERRQPIDVVELARQRRRQVEAEAVDVHLLHPVAQRVHHQLQRVRMPHVQAVAGAGVVHVVAGVALDRPVVGAVVDPLEAQHRPEVVAFAGVVVDHVEDHLEPGGVQRLHHRLELAHLAAHVAPATSTRRAARSSRRSCSPSSCAAPCRADAARARTGAPAAVRRR